MDVQTQFDDVSTKCAYLREMLFFQKHQLSTAIQQICLLNSKIQALKKRYTKASLSEQYSFMYNLRLRMATIEGVRCAFFRYAEHRSNVIMQMNDQVEVLEEQMVQLPVSDGEGADAGYNSV